MIAHSPIWTHPGHTDLGDAFELHIPLSRKDSAYVLGVETHWLDVVRARAQQTQDPGLIGLTTSMLSLLANPQGHSDFKQRFEQAYKDALQMAYPVTRALYDEYRLHSGISQDYTLKCFDFGQVRAIEDEALSDPSLKTFAQDMLHALQARSKLPRHKVYPPVFNIYSEALVCRLLRERSGGRLKIEKIDETDQSSPDFECELDIDVNGEPTKLSFYIEVKSLDIVDAPQRLPEMLDDGMDMQIELDRQIDQGKRVATAEGVIAPHQRYGTLAGYDPRSTRIAIENIIQKSSSNFKNTQFRRGPTFALANLLRLPLLGQRLGTVAPFFHTQDSGGACVSGALWNVAFGEVDAPIHRTPEFEGKGTLDGTLQRAGILIDPSLGLDAAGLIVLHYDQDAYRFDGFYDARWTAAEWRWSDIQVEAVLEALCGAFNNRANGFAHLYASGDDRPAI